MLTSTLAASSSATFFVDESFSYAEDINVGHIMARAAETATSHQMRCSELAAHTIDGAAYTTADAATTAVWSALSADATAVNAGDGVAAVSATPLWPDGAPKALTDQWRTLKDLLLRRDATDGPQDGPWSVWTQWYDRRLAGEPNPIEDLEVARVLEPTNAQWTAGPAVINPLLAEIEARFRDELTPPPQDKRALTYAAPPGGPVDVDPDQIAGGLNADLLDDVRHYAREAARVCKTGGNAVQGLEGPFERLADYIDRHDGVPPNSAALWSRMNAMREALKANDAKPDDDLDESRRWPEDLRAPVAAGVAAINVAIANDEDLTRHEVQSAGPDAPAPAEETPPADPAPMRALLDDVARAPGVATEQAVEETRAVLDDAYGSGPLLRPVPPSADAPGWRGRLFATLSVKNFVIALLTAASAGGAVAAPGAAAAAAAVAVGVVGPPVMAVFVARHQEALHRAIDAIGGSQLLHDLVDRIAGNKD